MHYAASQGCEKIVKCLIENGATLNVKNKGGCTPLNLAIANKHKQIVEYLVEHGAKIDSASKASGCFELVK